MFQTAYPRRVWRRPREGGRRVWRACPPDSLDGEFDGRGVQKLRRFGNFALIWRWGGPGGPEAAADVGLIKPAKRWPRQCWRASPWRLTPARVDPLQRRPPPTLRREPSSGNRGVRLGGARISAATQAVTPDQAAAASKQRYCSTASSIWIGLDPGHATGAHWYSAAAWRRRRPRRAPRASLPTAVGPLLAVVRGEGLVGISAPTYRFR
jgi:hypothetical protein